MNWDNCLSNNVATLACLPVLYSNLINAALVFVGSAAVVFIIIGGIKYIMAGGGDPKKAESARKTITWAIIGLLLVVFAFTIVNTIAFFTGSNCIKSFGFDTCK